MSSYDEMYNYILQGLRERRVQDPYKVANAFHTEGLSKGKGWIQSRNPDAKVRYGGYEDSWGPLQMYTAGMGGDYMKETGVSPEDFRAGKNWKRSVDYGLDRLVQEGWGPWYGPQKKLGYKGRAYIGDAATPLNRWKDASAYDEMTPERLRFDQLVMASRPDPLQTDPLGYVDAPAFTDNVQAPEPYSLGPSDPSPAPDMSSRIRDYYRSQKSGVNDDYMLGRFAPAARTIGSALFQMGTGIPLDMETGITNDRKLRLADRAIDAKAKNAQQLYQMANEHYLSQGMTPEEAGRAAWMIATEQTDAMTALGLGDPSKEKFFENGIEYVHRNPDGTVDEYVVTRSNQNQFEVYKTTGGAPQKVEGLPSGARRMDYKVVGDRLVPVVPAIAGELGGGAQSGGAPMPGSPQEPAPGAMQQPEASQSTGVPGVNVLANPETPRGGGIVTHPDGTVEVIPNEYAKKRQELQATQDAEKPQKMREAVGAMRGMKNKIDNMRNAIGPYFEGVPEGGVHPDIEEAGTVWGALERQLPWHTTSGAIEGALMTVRAITGLTELQSLREAGGTLGQVTEAEHALLQAANASLDPRLDPATRQRNLEYVYKLGQVVLDEKRQMFIEQFGIDPFAEDQSFNQRSFDGSTTPDLRGGGEVFEDDQFRVRQR